MKQHKELRKEEKDTLREVKERLQVIKSDLSEFCKDNPDFIVETSLGRVKAGTKTNKPSSKIDISDSLNVLQQALAGAENRTLDAGLLVQLQAQLTREMLEVNAPEEERETVAKFTRSKTKHLGSLPAMNNGNMLRSFQRLLQQVPQNHAILPENNGGDSE